MANENEIMAKNDEGDNRRKRWKKCSANNSNERIIVTIMNEKWKVVNEIVMKVNNNDNQ